MATFINVKIPTIKKPSSKEGMAWCGKHRKFEPVSNFYKSKSRESGLTCDCKTAMQERRDILKAKKDQDKIYNFSF